MSISTAHEPAPVPSGLDEALHAALAESERRDKQAACDALFVAELALGAGPHPLRREIRAAACAIDISNWALAQHRIGAVLRHRADTPAG